MWRVRQTASAHSPSSFRAAAVAAGAAQDGGASLALPSAAGRCGSSHCRSAPAGQAGTPPRPPPPAPQFCRRGLAPPRRQPLIRAVSHWCGVWPLLCPATAACRWLPYFLSSTASAVATCRQPLVHMATALCCAPPPPAPFGRRRGDTEPPRPSEAATCHGYCCRPLRGGGKKLRQLQRWWFAVVTTPSPPPHPPRATPANGQTDCGSATIQHSQPPSLSPGSSAHALPPATRPPPPRPRARVGTTALGQPPPLVAEYSMPLPLPPCDACVSREGGGGRGSGRVSARRCRRSPPRPPPPHTPPSPNASRRREAVAAAVSSPSRRRRRSAWAGKRQPPLLPCPPPPS